MSALDDDVKTAFAGPAIHANRMIWTVSDAGVRLAFLESFPDKVPAMFRTAVLLSFADAAALREQLAAALTNKMASSAKPTGSH